MSDLGKLAKSQQAQVEYLVFGGGGAKGTAYTGAYSALVAADIMPGINAIAGSSAGAISAAVIATGIKPEDYAALAKATPLLKLVGNPTLSGMDGVPLFNIIAKTIQNNISQYLKSINIHEKCKERIEDISGNLGLLNKELKQIQALQSDTKNDNYTSKEVAERIEIIKHQIQALSQQEEILQSITKNGDKAFQELKDRCDNKGQIYFRDISLLRALDPGKFKDLVITATRKDTGELKIFSSELTPDVEIAMACKASASIPLFFRSVKIDGIDYVDGGYRDNFPSNHFKGAEKKQEAIEITDTTARHKTRGRSICFAFGSDMNDAANVAIYSSKEKIFDPSSFIKFIIDVVFKFAAGIGGRNKYSEDENLTHLKMREEEALNTVVVDTKNVGTLSFSKAERNARYLHIKAFNNVTHYLQNHELSHTSDPTLEFRNLALHVFEAVNDKNSAKWINKINPKILQEILSFADPELVKNFSTIELIKNFALFVGNEKKAGALPVESFIKVINDKTLISDKLKEELIKIIGIDKDKDHKFTKEDIVKYIETNKAVNYVSPSGHHRQK